MSSKQTRRQNSSLADNFSGAAAADYSRPARRMGDQAMKLALSIDRIFLFRRFFVALSLMLVVTGVTLAQNAGPRGHAHSNSLVENSSATKAARKSVTFGGETKPIGNDKVRSWVTLDTAGNPTAIGVTFGEEALNNLPAEPPAGAEGYALILALPKEAAQTPFNHVRVDWNPHGHPPEKVYDTGHFDFHFYMITSEERERITAEGDDLARAYKKIPDEYIPNGYVQVPGTAVPKMGAHLIHPLSPELNGQPFTKTFLFGAYDGQLIFAEPMITKAFLETKPNATESLKLPAMYAKSGYYPTRYSVRYDPARKEYTVALEGFVKR